MPEKENDKIAQFKRQMAELNITYSSIAKELGCTRNAVGKTIRDWVGGNRKAYSYPRGKALEIEEFLKSHGLSMVDWNQKNVTKEKNS